MLGDNPEKSKNILKKAIRRRAAKTVQFAPPTYVEASEVDYTSEEEDIEGGYYSNEDEGAALDDDEATAVADDTMHGDDMRVDEDEITPAEPPDTAKKLDIVEKAPVKPFSKAEVRNSEEIFDKGRSPNFINHGTEEPNLWL